MNPKYEKIINMQRPVSENYPKMDRKRRAAQFAPFEALSNFEEYTEEDDLNKESEQ